MFQAGYFGMRDNRAWIDEVMHHLDLAGKADANLRALSGGMKRRVLVAQALPPFWQTLSCSTPSFTW